MFSKKGRLELLFLLAVACWFGFTALYRLCAVPLLVDEARHGIWAVQALAGFKALFGVTPLDFSGGLYENIVSFSLPFYPDVVFPQMICFFVGAPIVYFLVPFIALSGPSVFALRIGFVLLGIASLFCVYYVVKRWFGVLVAMGCVALMAVNSSYLRSVRLGVEREEVFQIFLIWCGLACLVKGMDKGRGFFLVPAGFLWGVALWAKLSFAGILSGVLVAFCFMPSSGWKLLKDRIFCSPLRLGVFLFCTVVGMLPFITYNLKTGFASVFMSFKCFGGGLREYGNRIEYGSFWENLSIRAGQFWDFLCAHAGFDSIVTPDNMVGAVLAVLSIVVVGGYAFLRRPEKFCSKTIRALFAVYGVLFVLSVFSPTWHAPEHMVAFVPFVQICMALCFALAAGFFKSPKNGAVVFCVLVFASGLMEGEITGVLLRSVKAGAGRGKFMTSIINFMQELENLNPRPLVFVPSGALGANVFYGLGDDWTGLNVGKDTAKIGNGVGRFYFLCQTGFGADQQEVTLLAAMQNDPAVRLQRVLVAEEMGQQHAWELFEVSCASKARFDWVRDMVWNERLFWLPGQSPKALADVCRVLGWKYDWSGGRWNTKLTEFEKDGAV